MSNQKKAIGEENICGKSTNGDLIVKREGQTVHSTFWSKEHPRDAGALIHLELQHQQVNKHQRRQETSRSRAE